MSTENLSSLALRRAAGDVSAHSGDVIGTGAPLAATSLTSEKDNDDNVEPEEEDDSYDDIIVKSIVISPVSSLDRSIVVNPNVGNVCYL